MDTLQMLRGTLRSVFSVVRASLEDNPPDEWGVELNIGFKGTTTPIPVIVSGESSVAVFTPKWAKPKSGD